ncbi:MAG: helix-turn-helix domain-containing protein [Niastella sp.]|nr:helix-turn-helix domain-containing protein [Niastella sp.]
MELVNKAKALRELGEAIADTRKNKNMSIPQLAAKTKIEASILEQIEQGSYDVEYTKLLRIAKGLDTKFTYILPPLD